MQAIRTRLENIEQRSKPRWPKLRIPKERNVRRLNSGEEFESVLMRFLINGEI